MTINLNSGSIQHVHVKENENIDAAGGTIPVVDPVEPALVATATTATATATPTAATAATFPSSPPCTDLVYPTSTLRPPPVHIPKLSLVERDMHLTALTTTTFTNTYPFWKIAGARHIFGGDIMGQCIVASAATVPETFYLHSIHMYFVRGGDPGVPIKYEVTKVRTGRSFAMREVKALQRDKLVVMFMASFQLPVPAKNKATGAVTEWQVAMPEVPKPWEVPSEQVMIKQAEAVLASFGETVTLNKLRNPGDPSVAADKATLSSSYAALHRLRLRLDNDPFEWRVLQGPPVAAAASVSSSPTEAYSARKLRCWARVRERLSSTSSSSIPHAQFAALAYLADYWLLVTVARINPATASGENLAMLFSLDHTMYFHLGPETRVDEPGDHGWLFIEMDAPWVAQERGIVTQRIWRGSDGRLVATCSQEGLVRLKNDSIGKEGEDGSGLVAASSRSTKL